MKAEHLPIPGLMLLEPTVHHDERGFLYESFNQRAFNEATGTDYQFVQDNHTRSTKGVLRGMHYQSQQPQGKLVRAVRGAVYDVVVDVRRDSPAFGRWYGLELNESSHVQLWIPPGLAHGFLTLSDDAELLYKMTDYYEPQLQSCLAWNDPSVGIAWPLQQHGIVQPILSAKDKAGKALFEI